jgi:predicted nucleic acid-binding Zn ribbon protein
VAYEAEDHRHCKVCGKVVGPGEEFCSKAHRRERERMVANRRQLSYLMYAAIAFFVLLLVTQYVHL